MTARYRRVPVTDPEEEESKKLRVERVDRITSKLHAIFWILAAMGVFWLTDVSNIIHSDKINRLTFNLAIVCFVANLGIFLYLVAWLPLVLKVTAPWEVYCPNMIPASTGLAVACMILLMITFWPVWGLLAPVYITVMVMGLIFSAHFIPWPC